MVCVVAEQGICAGENNNRVPFLRGINRILHIAIVPIAVSRNAKNICRFFHKIVDDSVDKLSVVCFHRNVNRIASGDVDIRASARNGEPIVRFHCAGDALEVFSDDKVGIVRIEDAI